MCDGGRSASLVYGTGSLSRSSVSRVASAMHKVMEDVVTNVSTLPEGVYCTRIAIPSTQHNTMQRVQWWRLRCVHTVDQNQDILAYVVQHANV